MRYAPPPVAISRWQALTPTQNVQILSVRLPRSGMVFTSEQITDPRGLAMRRHDHPASWVRGRGLASDVHVLSRLVQL
jgi:hypothetical protein